MIPRKGMNPTLAKLTQQRKENMLISAAGKANLIISLMVLADKFDFTPEQLDKFIDESQKQLEAYNSGYVESVKDFTGCSKKNTELRWNYDNRTENTAHSRSLRIRTAESTAYRRNGGVDSGD